MQLLQRASSIKNWIDRLAKQSSEYEKNKIHQKVQISRRIELWIELAIWKTITIKVNFYPIQALSRQ